MAKPRRNKRPRRFYDFDRRASDEGYAPRFCGTCDCETEHEGVYCVPCWNAGRSCPVNSDR